LSPGRGRRRSAGAGRGAGGGDRRRRHGHKEVVVLVRRGSGAVHVITSFFRASLPVIGMFVQDFAGFVKRGVAGLV